MSIHVSTTTTFEVEIDLTGDWYPGYSATRDDPGCDDEVDDCNVEGVFALRSQFDRKTGKHTWDRVDIFTGLDKAARDQIAANILAFLGDEAAELITAEAHS